MLVATLAQRAGELNSTRGSSDANARHFLFPSQEGTPSFGCTRFPAGESSRRFLDPSHHGLSASSQRHRRPYFSSINTSSGDLISSSGYPSFRFTAL